MRTLQMAAGKTRMNHLRHIVYPGANINELDIANGQKFQLTNESRSICFLNRGRHRLSEKWEVWCRGMELPGAEYERQTTKKSKSSTSNMYNIYQSTTNWFRVLIAAAVVLQPATAARRPASGWLRLIREPVGTVRDQCNTIVLHWRSESYLCSLTVRIPWYWLSNQWVCAHVGLDRPTFCKVSLLSRVRVTRMLLS